MSDPLIERAQEAIEFLGSDSKLGQLIETLSSMLQEEWRASASPGAGDRWATLVTEGEAAGCYPCDTCGGFRAKGAPCQFCTAKLTAGAKTEEQAPSITPEVSRRLTEEGRALRADLRARLLAGRRKMD